MQPSPFSTPSSSSWMHPNNPNSATNNSNFWSNGGFRKRKADATDLDDHLNQKMFVTEEKMVKEMQTLSLDLASLNNNITISTVEPKTSHEDDKNSDDDDDDDDNKDKSLTENEERTRLELHQLLKDSLKNDDLHDSLISKLCAIECKKLSMQLVPYMPIHPSQLNNDNITTDEKIDEENNSSPGIADELKNESDNHLFKIPSIPTPYTVEEPCDDAIKRNPNMKRSYSQSDQYNSNLSVTELKHDINDFSSLTQSQSGYFIVEPTAAPLVQSSPSTSSSSLSCSEPSVRITEVLENPISTNELTNTLDDDDIDMQSVASSDAGDKMDDD